MAVKSIFRSSNPSESFQSKTFQFSLGKVCLALEKFHKTQRSHQHATDAPSTHLVPYKFKEWPTRRSTVDRLSTDCRPTVDRLSADCRPTRWPTCLPTRRWDRILYLDPFSLRWIALRRNPIEDGAISGFSGQNSVPE